MRVNVPSPNYVETLTSIRESELEVITACLSYVALYDSMTVDCGIGYNDLVEDQLEDLDIAGEKQFEAVYKLRDLLRKQTAVSETEEDLRRHNKHLLMTIVEIKKREYKKRGDMERVLHERKRDKKRDDLLKRTRRAATSK